MLDLEKYLAEKRSLIDKALDEHMPAEDTQPGTIHKAMRYSVFSGGKRIRPILCLAAAKAAGAQEDNALLPAVAIELLHTYTLIHDDLPCMDNDDTRRGKPTSHKVFGEAMAVLAGDALLTLAFELLSNAPSPDLLARELAHAAGSRGVIGGQVEDIEHSEKPSFEEIQYVHLHKTAALFRASMRIGAIAANADQEQIDALSNYGTGIGLAFQVTDDLLDIDQAENNELSCLMVYSPEEAKAKVVELIEQAIAELSDLNETEPLVAIARFIADRET